SAPTPLLRSQIRRQKSPRSLGAWMPSMMRKSFPQAVAFTNGLTGARRLIPALRYARAQKLTGTERTDAVRSGHLGDHGRFREVRIELEGGAAYAQTSSSRETGAPARGCG